MRRSLQTCRVTARRKPAAYLRDRAHASNASSSPTRTDDAVAARADGASACRLPPRYPPRPWLYNATHIAEIKLREPGQTSPIFNQKYLLVTFPQTVIEVCWRWLTTTYALRYDAIVRARAQDIMQYLIDCYIWERVCSGVCMPRARGSTAGRSVTSARQFLITRIIIYFLVCTLIISATW